MYCARAIHKYTVQTTFLITSPRDTCSRCFFTCSQNVLAFIFMWQRSVFPSVKEVASGHVPNRKDSSHTSSSQSPRDIHLSVSAQWLLFCFVFFKPWQTLCEVFCSVFARSERRSVHSTSPKTCQMLSTCESGPSIKRQRNLCLCLVSSQFHLFVKSLESD